MACPLASAGGNQLIDVGVVLRLLGFVSMLMDISSEMIHSRLPLFMVGTLGASFTFYMGAVFSGVALLGLLRRAQP